MPENWSRVIEAIVGAAESVAKSPLGFVAGFFSVLFFIYQIWGRDDCNYWRVQYEVERTKNNDLQNALLIKNGVINNLRETRLVQDSLIKDMTIEPVQDLLEENYYEK